MLGARCSRRGARLSAHRLELVAQLGFGVQRLDARLAQPLCLTSLCLQLALRYDECLGGFLGCRFGRVESAHRRRSAVPAVLLSRAGCSTAVATRRGCRRRAERELRRAEPWRRPRLCSLSGRALARPPVTAARAHCRHRARAVCPPPDVRKRRAW
eukprot:scaffold55737_cov23-Tisochrysis_lutea.AAC.1